MKLNKDSIAYFTLVIMLAGTAFFSVNMFLNERTNRDMADVRNFPRELGAWRGSDLDLSEKEYEILETRNLISRKYTNSKGENIHLFIIYSETNRSVFHPPEVCMMGGGINMVDKTSEKIDSEKLDFLANKLTLEKNGLKSMTLYAYKAGGFYTDSYYRQQIHFALNQLLGKRKGGATIRVSMGMRESEKATLDTLKRFMKRVIEALEKLA